jgi:putative transposase
MAGGMDVRALGVSRGGFYAWLTRPRSRRSRSDEELGAKVRASFLASERAYGARRVWHNLIADGMSCGLHRIERLMRQQGLKARPRRRRLPPDLGARQAGAIASNMLDRSFEAPAPNRKWIADSPTSEQQRADSMWRQSSICSPGAWSAGR